MMIINIIKKQENFSYTFFIQIVSSERESTSDLQLQVVYVRIQSW